VIDAMAGCHGNGVYPNSGPPQATNMNFLPIGYK